MIACERTNCPWWDEDGCLSDDCGDMPEEWDRYCDMNGMEDEDE